MKKYVLWTGGWDSTYRMVELSRRDDIEIYPIYIRDHTRPSLQIEINTVEKLYKQLVEDKRTKAKINPLTYIEDCDIPENIEITTAYQRIKEKIKIGSQYEYIARLAISYPGIELGIEKPNGEFSGCVEVINQFGRLKECDGGYVLDLEKSSKDCNMLFENVAFPIINLTEIEMLENIKNWGYIEFMKGIHFCYTPHRNYPCGICRPCQQKMECGMEMLLPKRAQIRYKIYSWRVANGGILSRIIWKLTNIFS
ncbi:hypothetical protein [Coprococcus sp. AF21-14LB]|uniref:hypothetical protein n=1 Tax=Coprococcus sp. AF21-14LB TaxID=2292231 RepID=UPI000E4AC710|nr:hypothetical protein [Coprococcus sp. AF21-14LB]RGS76396.1 hypothetical protein DWX73_12255 [Coprococcus sp. AF21-14LB]